MFTRLLTPLIHLFYPHCCELCDTDLQKNGELLCLHCQHTLPATGFHQFSNNPVATIFQGRIQVQYAAAAYYYSRSSGLQQLIHKLKYKQRPDIATWLGKQMGYMLLTSNWLSSIDYIVPVPLFPRKEKLRGYNQAILLSNGIAQITQIPVKSTILNRHQPTLTQTKQGRASRWQNVANAFHTCNNEAFNHHVLLVDDVITTGATMEACSKALQQAGAKVSIYCLAVAYG